MQRDELNHRLSQLATSWSVLRQAHQGDGSAVASAQELLVTRYRGAIYRYLLSAVRDPHEADELTQEFAVKLVQGAFRNVTPERGRFRDYLKTVLFHLVSQHRKQLAKRLPTLAADAPELAALAAAPDDSDLAFTESWRTELLARTWDALADVQSTFHTVLRFRADHPDMASDEMAELLSRQLAKPLTPSGVRQTLHRARETFAELLLEEVGRSLEEPTLVKVEEELGELNLLSYCQAALEKKAGGG